MSSLRTRDRRARLVVIALVAIGAGALAASCGDVEPAGQPLGGTTTTASTTTSTSSSTSTASGGGMGSTSTTSAGGAGGIGGGGGAGGAGGSGGANVGGAGGASGATSTTGAGGGACGTTVESFPIDPSPHVPVCTPVDYATNPPTSGPHYPVWAAFKTYDIPIPRGFWVHDMEHGAVVISYNCPKNCDAELAQLQAFLQTLTPDPLCTPPLTRRIVVVPDPLLDVRFAASAWGWALESSCFDLDALAAFIDAHYAQGPEDFCSDGTDLSQPGSYPDGCGEVQDAGAD